jgi:phosphate/phosphite/phosphonate ABC transporter binding protein
MLRRVALLLVGLPLALGSALVACTRQEPPLTLVFTPSRDPTALKEAGDAFAQTLTRVSGVRIRALVASDYAGVIEALRSRRVDLAFVHPVGYVLANREAGCQILVRDIWQGKTAYTARFYVRKDRGIKQVADLRGKTIAFVDPASSSGYIYPMVFLMKEGLVRDRDPKSFFKEALFSGTHEAALQAVLHGRVDAAASFDEAPELHLKIPRSWRSSAGSARRRRSQKRASAPDPGCPRSRWPGSSARCSRSRRPSTPRCSRRSTASTGSSRRPTPTTARCATP